MLDQVCAEHHTENFRSELLIQDWEFWCPAGHQPRAWLVVDPENDDEVICAGLDENATKPNQPSVWFAAGPQFVWDALQEAMDHGHRTARARRPNIPDDQHSNGPTFSPGITRKTTAESMRLGLL